MLLREMTDPAFAHSVKRFAQCAVVGLALAGLAACGGGSSTPAKVTPTPEITIAPGGDTLENAVDIMGKETVEGQLDSPDDADHYELRPDEDVVVVFYMDTADVEFQLLDSEGNVLATAISLGTGTGSSSGLPAPAAAGAGFYTIGYLLRGGTKYIVRVFPKKGAAFTRGVKRYVLNHRFTKAALRQIRTFVKHNVEAGKVEDIELGRYYTAEGDTRLTYSANLATLDLGVFELAVTTEGSKLKLSPSSSTACRGRASPLDARIKVDTTVRLPVPDLINIALNALVDVTATDFLVATIHDSGPRLRSSVTPPISLTVAADSSATTTLTDFIEDPEGGSTIKFTVGSVSTGLGATLDGPRLTVTAREGAANGSITVAATDKNDVCRTFSVGLGATVAVKPQYQDGVRVSVEGGRPTYISDDPLDEFFIVPPGSEISYALELLYRDVGQYGERWRITSERRMSLEVPSSAWESVDLPVTIEGVVVARDRHGTEARLRFFVTFTEPELCPAGYQHSISALEHKPGCYCVPNSGSDDPNLWVGVKCS